MIKIKDKFELEGMRASGRLAATVREKVKSQIAPGVRTSDLDAYAIELTQKLGGRSAFFGYRGFPGNICISVNDEVVHGIPGPRVIRLGDIVSIDVGVVYDGFIGDNATTVMVGVTDPDVIRLVEATERALHLGIAQAVAGNRLSDISHAVEREGKKNRLSIVKDFVGHGVGREMHEDPQIPNFGPPGRGPRLREGMTLALEPMFNLGTEEVEVMADGWTVLTRDRKPSAHFEHTVAVHEGQAEILTLPGDD